MAMIRVNVTKEDIYKGRPLRGDDCPVALAMQRACRRRDLSVGTLTIMSARGVVGKVPPAMRAFIIDFDRGLTVKPAKFAVNLRLLPTASKAGKGE